MEEMTKASQPRRQMERQLVQTQQRVWPLMASKPLTANKELRVILDRAAAAQE
jgi:hypothetical protein